MTCLGAEAGIYDPERPTDVNEVSHYFKAQRQDYYQRLQDVRDGGRWEDWLKFFLRGVAEVKFPLISVNPISEMLGVSFTSANRLIDRMVDTGILVESTGNARNRVFNCSDYIRLFTDR